MRYHLVAIRESLSNKTKQNRTTSPQKTSVLKTCRNWNSCWKPCALLVGMQNGAAAMEKRIECLDKLNM